VNLFLCLAMQNLISVSIKLQWCTPTGSGLASLFAFQLILVEFRPLFTVSSAVFLVAGFLNASCAAVAAELTA
jgi:hypothetical protein